METRHSRGSGEPAFVGPQGSGVVYPCKYKDYRLGQASSSNAEQSKASESMGGSARSSDLWGNWRPGMATQSVRAEERRRAQSQARKGMRTRGGRRIPMDKVEACSRALTYCLRHDHDVDVDESGWALWVDLKEIPVVRNYMIEDPRVLERDGRLEVSRRRIV